MGNSNRFGWIKVRSGDTSYVGSVKHSHSVLYMHEQIPQGVFVFDAGQGDVIMGCYGKTSMQYPDNLKNGTASRNENNALVESPKADKEA